MTGSLTLPMPDGTTRELTIPEIVPLTRDEARQALRRKRRNPKLAGPMAQIDALVDGGYSLAQAVWVMDEHMRLSRDVYRAMDVMV